MLSDGICLTTLRNAVITDGLALRAATYPMKISDFFIKYMGDDGSRQLVQVAFINHKPARSFINMMSLWSGLESENLQSTVTADKRTASKDPDSVQPFEDVTTSPNAKSKGAHNLGQGSVPAKRYRKASQPQPKACWSAYLEANPSMSVGPTRTQKRQKRSNPRSTPIVGIVSGSLMPSG